MITADLLALLTNMPVCMLNKGIREAGHKKDEFTSARFLGMTNAGLFCYMVTFTVEGGTDSGKVFVKYDYNTNSVTVDY